MTKLKITQVTAKEMTAKVYRKRIHKLGAAINHDFILNKDFRDIGSANVVTKLKEVHRLLNEIEKELL